MNWKEHSHLWFLSKESVTVHSLQSYQKPRSLGLHTITRHYIGDEDYWWRLLVYNFLCLTSINSDTQSGGPQWKMCIARFNNWLVAMDVASKDRQKCILLGRERLKSMTRSKTPGWLHGNQEQAHCTLCTTSQHPIRNLHIPEHKARWKWNGGPILHPPTHTCTNLSLLIDTDKEIHSQMIQLCNPQELWQETLHDQKWHCQDSWP